MKRWVVMGLVGGLVFVLRRKTVPQETRVALAATIRAIDLDIRTLRKDL